MIDEQGYGDDRRRQRMGIRSAVLASLHAGQFMWYSQITSKKQSPVNRMRSLGYLLRYADSICAGTKRKTPVKVDQLVDAWIEALVGMCLAHDKDAYDAHDAAADELLGPLLSAPVKQIREFYHALLAKMKADPRVPMLVWMGFDAWGEAYVKDAPDECVRRLKNKLASEIANLVEEPIRDQIPKAIERALRWRDPSELKTVKEKLQSGVKPKLRGRESCLFLECGTGKNKVSVML